VTVTRARRWWVVGIGVAVIAAISAASVVLYRWQLPRVREKLVQILSDELGAKVELADLQVGFGRQVRVVGRGLVLHHKSAPADVPPLVRIARFSISVAAIQAFRKPAEITSVELENMEIFIPKRTRPDDERVPGRRITGPSPVVIRELRTIDATLSIQSGKPDRPPRTFAIHDLRLRDAAFDQAVHFDARLTNPKPTGEVQATGSFGPWAADEPSETPLEGKYTFADADLSTIKGISGILDSTGRFSGTLDQIDVKGTTTTPDFGLDIGGMPLKLDTTYVALVDGTNGDTILHDVTAVLGETPITAKGGVVHTPGRKGRTVILEATIEKGRLHDILRLALDDAPPPMNGQITLRSTVNLPPGEPRVVDRLELDGEFTIAGLRFESDMVQGKVDEFSRRGQGRPQDEDIQNVASLMRGRYQLKDGVLRFRQLRFGVRGADVQLNGHYVLKGGALDFSGTVRLDARASQTMTGWKSWVTKVFDPLLAKDGAGTVLPIKVTGTAKQPKFGVEVKKIF
jgi:hypothetical protein